MTLRRRFLVAGALLGAAALGYLLLWPTGLDPHTWSPPPAPPREGIWAPNAGFADLELLLEGLGKGPEDVAVGPDGQLYTGFEDGRIVRFQRDPGLGAGAEVFARIEGRPLGMKFDAGGNLIVCDGHGGLLSIDATGAVAVLTSSALGAAIVFTDDLDIAPDGSVWFSEASVRHPPGASATDALEGVPTGRLLRYDPVTEQTTVHLTDLRYANGVAVDPGGAFVLVAETFGYRITRLWLTGAHAGEHDVFAANLPGFVDNLNFDARGRLWVAFVKPRSEILDWAGPRPWVRQLIARLPEFLLPVPPPLAFVAALDADGELAVQLQDPSVSFGDITSATPVDDMLLLGSLNMPAVGVIPLP